MIGTSMTAKNRLVSQSLFVLGMGALSFLFVGPFLWMIQASFKPTQDIFTTALSLFPRRITLNGYIQLFSSYPYATWYMNSAIMTAGHTLLTLAISVLGGFALAKYNFPGRNFVFILILSSMMLPFHLMLIPLFITLVRYRMIDTYWGVIVPFSANPFGVFFLRQFILGIDSAMLDAARIDGATELQLFYRIVLPLTRPALATLAVLFSLGMWNDLLWPLIVMRTTEHYPLSVGLASLTSTYRPQYDVLMAGSFLSVLPIIVLYLFMQKTFTRGMAITSGMKG